MSAGRRNRKVMFQRATTTTDDYGGEVPDWLDYASALASVNFGTGQERREAAQEAGSIPATFRVLRNTATAALSVKDRISFDGGNWDITSIAPSRELNRYLDITAIRSAN